jgi:hypothetical protein
VNLILTQLLFLKCLCTRIVPTQTDPACAPLTALNTDRLVMRLFTCKVVRLAPVQLARATAEWLSETVFTFPEVTAFEVVAACAVAGAMPMAAGASAAVAPSAYRTFFMRTRLPPISGPEIPSPSEFTALSSRWAAFARETIEGGVEVVPGLGGIAVGIIVNLSLKVVNRARLWRSGR